jgi:hypothetical protein
MAGLPEAVVRYKGGMMMVLFVMGCGAGGSGDLNSVGAGKIDGTPWRSAATWTFASESRPLNADPADGWWPSAVGQQMTDGRGLAGVLSAPPAEVDLSDGGWALLYTDDRTERSSWAAWTSRPSPDGPSPARSLGPS